MTPYMWFAIAMWFCMIVGFWLRRNRQWHVPLMLTGIFGDIALVIFLSVTRNAMHTALELKLKLLQQIHIGVSSVALILYVPIVYFGYQLLRGNYQYRKIHFKLGLWVLYLRTLGVLFMFSMWKD